MAKQQFDLYNGKVQLVFDDEASTTRYRVTDKEKGLDNQPARGVTTVLGNVFDKPGLRMYPLNEAMKYLFGAEWNNTELKSIYNHQTAKLVPGPGEFTLPDLQELLDQCYAKAKEKSQAGKDTGSEIHKAIERYLRSIPTSPKPEWLDHEVSSDIRKAYDAFRKWFQQHQPKVLKVEQPIYSRELGYAGRFDCLLEIDGRIHLCDIKTTQTSRYALKKGKDWTGIYPENFLQMGAYSLAYSEEMVFGHQERLKKIQHINRSPKQLTEAKSQLTRVNDLTVINVNKEGKLVTLSASELGLDVQRLENAAQATMRLHNLLSDMYKVKPTEVHADV